MVGEAHRNPVPGDEVDQLAHELGAMAVALRPVARVEHQHPDLGEAGLLVLPPVLQAVHQAAAGHPGGDQVDAQLVVLRRLTGVPATSSGDHSRYGSAAYYSEIARRASSGTRAHPGEAPPRSGTGRSRTLQGTGTTVAPLSIRRRSRLGP